MTDKKNGAYYQLEKILDSPARYTKRQIVDAATRFLQEADASIATKTEQYSRLMDTYTQDAKTYNELVKETQKQVDKTKEEFEAARKACLDAYRAAGAALDLLQYIDDVDTEAVNHEFPSLVSAPLRRRLFNQLREIIDTVFHPAQGSLMTRQLPPWRGPDGDGDFSSDVTV